MNIKTITNNIVPLEGVHKGEDKKQVKSESSSERDANGRRERDSAPEKNHLNEEELKKVLDTLKSIPGIKENNLIIRVQEINNTHFFFVEDLKGKVIRRMSTNEAWVVTQIQDTKTGHLLNKSM